MINLIIGRAGSGKSTLLSEMIKNEIVSGSSPVVLLVPEQQTVVWETKMASMLPASANLRLEITNFTRLSNSVFRQGGGLVDPVIDEGSRGLLVWRAMLSVWEHLKVYNRAHEDKCIPHLTKAIDELKSSGISPAEAEGALLSLLSQQSDGDIGRDGDLCSRLSDAVMVYAAYEEILHREYIDRGDLLHNLADALDKIEYFRGKTVFVDSFFSLTAPEERILYRIMSQAEDVTLTFTCPTDAQERRNEIQFGECAEYLKNVTAMAARLGLDINRTQLTDNLRHKNAPALAAVEKHLFNYTLPLPKQEEREDEGEVKIVRCTDRFDEAEACAAIIERLLREGYRNSDIAVVAGNMSSREGVLDTVLRRHGINCFMSEPGSVSSSPAVRLVTAALGVAVGGWQRKNIIKLLKTGMTPVGRAPKEQAEAFEGDMLESYTATWNIRGRKMYTSGSWTMNPDGYTAELSGSGEEILRRANSARDKLIPPLDRLLSVFDEGVANVRDICERIVLFAEEYGVGQTLSEIGNAYRAIGMNAEAKKAETSWSSVCEILDKMVNMLGDTRIDASRFSGLFRRVAASMDVSTIPTGIDEVVLGNATGIRFESVRCVIILGSVDGEFPASVKDTGAFFDEGDKTVLESAGLKLGSPDLDMRTAREYFMYYRAASAPSDKLFVLAATAGDMSEGGRRIRAITEGLGYSSFTNFAAMPLSEVVFGKAGAQYQLSRRSSPEDIALLTALAGGAAASQIPLTAENDMITLPFADKNKVMQLSQSKIDSFVLCPFNYSCKYLLGLQPDPIAEIQTNDIGNFIHHILEHFLPLIYRDGTVDEDISDEELHSVSDKLIREYLDTLSRDSGIASSGKSDGRIEYLFLRLCRYVPVFIRCILDELKQSKFRPVAFELPMGLDKEGAVLPISFNAEDGTEVVLRGQADRVDLYENDGKKYLRIIDYKTGSKAFSPENVARGIDIQLLVYLFTLWKKGIAPLVIDGEILPAGAMYLNLKPAAHSIPSDLSPENAAKYTIDKIQRSGIFLADEDVLRAMDRELEGKYVGAGMSKNGIKGSKSATILSIDEFEELYNSLEKTVGNIATDMKCGRAEANPLIIGDNNPCKWCSNKYICKASKAEGEE